MSEHITQIQGVYLLLRRLCTYTFWMMRCLPEESCFFSASISRLWKSSAILCFNVKKFLFLIWSKCCHCWLLHVFSVTSSLDPIGRCLSRKCDFLPENFRGTTFSFYPRFSGAKLVVSFNFCGIHLYL